MADVAAVLEHTEVKPGHQHPSIGVLPFTNMSREPDDDYFSDGLAEELINLLAHVPIVPMMRRRVAPTVIFAGPRRGAEERGASRPPGDRRGLPLPSGALME